MQPIITTSTFIYLITVVLCFVAGSILWIFSRNRMVDNRWLAGYYFISGYGLLVGFLLYSRLISFFPWYHTYRTGYIAGFLLMPISFLYIRSLIQQKKFRPIDFVHFLPAIIFIIDFIPFYLKPGEFKLQQLAVDATQLDTTWNEFSQGWLGLGPYYTLARIILSTFYWIWEVRIIAHSSKLGGGDRLVTENKEVMRWAKIFCGVQVLIFMPYYINLLFGDRGNFFFYAVTSIPISVSITIIALIMQPNILYGLKGILIRNAKDAPREYPAMPDLGETKTGATGLEARVETPGDSFTQKNDSEELYLSGQKLHDLGGKLEAYIVLHRSYLKKGCTSAELAKEMNIQPYLLSAVINQVFHTNFNDFLNRYRIKHAKSLIESGEAKLVTLEALAEQSGFNNRNSFTLAFKKHTGQTPSDFIKQAGIKKD